MGNSSAERAAQSSNYRQLELARGVRGAQAETLEERAARCHVLES